MCITSFPISSAITRDRVNISYDDFSALPDEIVLLILEKLPSLDLFNVSWTCRRFHEIANGRFLRARLPKISFSLLLNVTYYDCHKNSSYVWSVYRKHLVWRENRTKITLEILPSQYQRESLQAKENYFRKKLSSGITLNEHAANLFAFLRNKKSSKKKLYDVFDNYFKQLSNRQQILVLEKIMTISKKNGVGFEKIFSSYERLFKIAWRKKYIKYETMKIFYQLSCIYFMKENNLMYVKKALKKLKKIIVIFKKDDRESFEHLFKVLIYLAVPKLDLKYIKFLYKKIFATQTEKIKYSSHKIFGDKNVVRIFNEGFKASAMYGYYELFTLLQFYYKNMPEKWWEGVYHWLEIFYKAAEGGSVGILKILTREMKLIDSDFRYNYYELRVPLDVLSRAYQIAADNKNLGALRYLFTIFLNKLEFLKTKLSSQHKRVNGYKKKIISVFFKAYEKVENDNEYENHMLKQLDLIIKKDVDLLFISAEYFFNSRNILGMTFLVGKLSKRKLTIQEIRRFHYLFVKSLKNYLKERGEDVLPLEENEKPLKDKLHLFSSKERKIISVFTSNKSFGFFLDKHVV